MAIRCLMRQKEWTSLAEIWLNTLCAFSWNVATLLQLQPKRKFAEASKNRFVLWLRITNKQHNCFSLDQIKLNLIWLVLCTVFQFLQQILLAEAIRGFYKLILATDIHTMMYVEPFWCTNNEILIFRSFSIWVLINWSAYAVGMFVRCGRTGTIE